MGIAEQMKPKIVLAASGAEAGKLLAGGEVESSMDGAVRPVVRVCRGG